MAVTLSVLSLVGGFLLGLFSQTFMARRNADLAALNELIEHIERVERLAEDYWLEGGDANVLTEQVASTRLKVALFTTQSFEASARRIFAANFQVYLDLDGDLFDAATGGTFQVSGRPADPERCLLVAVSSHRLKSFVREQRRKVFWAH